MEICRRRLKPVIKRERFNGKTETRVFSNTVRKIRPLNICMKLAVLKKPAKVRHSDTRHGDYTDAGRGERNTRTRTVTVLTSEIDVSAKDVQRRVVFDRSPNVTRCTKVVVEQKNNVGSTWIGENYSASDVVVRSRCGAHPISPSSS